MDNMQIYNKVRAVPKEALKEIQAGRLKGKSDINPMWRLKTLTEQFGLCGFGWRYEITKQWIENGGVLEGIQEVSAFVNINLYIKIDGEWSEAIPGTGGSSFISKEGKDTAKAYTSDECFKMALTDAISVACKALGVGADVYWSADKTKYDKPEQPKQGVEPSGNQNTTNYTKPENKQPQQTTATYKCECDEDITKAEHDYSLSKFGKPLCRKCQKAANQAS